MKSEQFQTYLLFQDSSGKQMHSVGNSEEIDLLSAKVVADGGLILVRDPFYCSADAPPNEQL